MNRTETITQGSSASQCEGIVTYDTEAVILTCRAAGCPVAQLANGVIIGRHSVDITNESLRRLAVLELPEVCPELADFDSNPAPERLPRGL